jgi:hypothetical protein
MAAPIIQLRTRDGACVGRNVETETDAFLLDSFRFLSMCAKCKDVRSQGGFGSRTLLRLLTRGHPIEAYCVVCDEFWEIRASERAALAQRLICA